MFLEVLGGLNFLLFRKSNSFFKIQFDVNEINFIMVKLIGILLIIVVLGCTNQNQNQPKPDLTSQISAQMEYAVQLANSLKDSVLVSPRTVEDGKLKLVKSGDWTSGFFPGNLWMVYEITGIQNGNKLHSILLCRLQSNNGMAEHTTWVLKCSAVSEKPGSLLAIQHTATF